MVVHGDVAVLCRSGATERRAERVGVREAVESQGYRVSEIEAPGHPRRRRRAQARTDHLGGTGGRSNASGIEQLRTALEGHRVEVLPVPVTKVLHLKSAVTALPDGSIIGYPPLVDDPTVWDQFLAVPEESGAHVVLLGGNSVLMSAAAPRTAQLLEARGHDVTTVDISEFEKVEGCVTCLSVRLRG